MPELSTPYAPRIRAPQLIQRTKTQLVSLDVYRDGAKIDFTSGLYSLQDQTGKFILEDQNVNKVDSSAQYTIAASQVPSTTTLSEGWMETWKITIGSTQYTFKRLAYICLSPIYPVISDIDLTTLYPDLSNLLPTGESSWQKWIDESWFQVLNRIRIAGRLPYLIMDPHALREPHINLCLSLIWRALHSALGQSEGRYLDLAREHERAFERTFSSMNFRYDEDEDGVMDDPYERTGGVSQIYLSDPPRAFYRRFGMR